MSGAVPPPAKVALRSQIAAALSSLSPAQVVAQSAAVFSHLSALPASRSCASASIYLPMDGGKEVDTWPIVSELLSRGAGVCVPRVTGQQPSDMAMLRLSSLEQAQGFGRTRWGIPEPSASEAEAMEDATESAELSLLLVPAVAFDARCGRLGHGRGYYDAFVRRQRALKRGEGGGVTVVGLALREQIIDFVPMDGDRDERVDMVITPDGPLAFTTAEERERAAGMMAGTAGESDGDGEAAASSSDALAPVSDRCEVASGRYKYACLRVSPPRSSGGEPFIAVRSGRGSYHADVAEPAVEYWESQGYDVAALGGGRIVRDDEAKTVSIYGFSVGFGGSEGGPPGRGMADHSQAAELVRQLLPSYTVNFSAEGY